MVNPMWMRMSPAARLAAGAGGAAAVAVLAAACASGGGSSSAPASPAGSGASGNGSGGTVITTASTSAGAVLTDGSGRAVYLWVKDTGKTSACTGACASAWPPVTTTGTVSAAGRASASDLGTSTRPDGTKQVTYNGHPLYYYAGDSGAGMASGQGSDSFGAKWWLVSPSGSDVTASVSSFTVSGRGAPAAPSSSKSAGGY
jgi:predicted lipoprotein with Yx(FWY)xxD motif